MLQILLRELRPEDSRYIHGRTGTTESSGSSRIFQTGRGGANLKRGANLYIIFPNFFQKLHEIEKKMDGEAQLALIGFDYLIDRSNYFLTYIVM